MFNILEVVYFKQLLLYTSKTVYFNIVTLYFTLHICCNHASKLGISLRSVYSLKLSEMVTDSLVCTFCELNNTKYSCIECGIVVCNVCAVSVEESNYSEYDKEVKKVSVYKKCSKKAISVELPRKKVEKNIYSLFQKQTVSQRQSNNSFIKRKAVVTVFSFCF